MKKLTILKSFLIGAALLLSSCSGNQAQGSGNNKVLSYIGKTANEITSALDNHRTHGGDKFELTMSATQYTVFYSLIIHCGSDSTGNQKVYYSIGKTSTEIETFMKNHSSHVTDEIVLSSAATQYTTYYSVIISCKN